MFNWIVNKINGPLAARAKEGLMFLDLPGFGQSPTYEQLVFNCASDRLHDHLFHVFITVRVRVVLASDAAKDAQAAHHEVDDWHHVDAPQLGTNVDFEESSNAFALLSILLTLCRIGQRTGCIEDSNRRFD
jgi:hypothetical protein